MCAIKVALVVYVSYQIPYKIFFRKEYFSILLKKGMNSDRVLHRFIFTRNAVLLSHLFKYNLWLSLANSPRLRCKLKFKRFFFYFCFSLLFFRAGKKIKICVPSQNYYIIAILP